MRIELSGHTYVLTRCLGISQLPDYIPGLGGVQSEREEARELAHI